jgi:hypothetical protein
MFKGKLIISGNNAKTVKGDGTEYETAIMYLAPFTMAGMGNVCAMAERAACWQGCLNTAGRGAMNSVQRARLSKTRFYMSNRDGFMAQLVDDLAKFSAYCKRKNVKPCVRLNGTSDIMWEKGHPVTRVMPCPILDGATVPVRYNSLMEAFPEIQFYDYTKIYTRVDKTMPRNYALTLSYSEANPDFAQQIMRRVKEGKANMAVVFRCKFAVGHFLGAGFHDLPCIDGDMTDMRFLDPQGGHVVALYAKGKAKKDTSGFVID